ncbi:hypothetical protein PVAND_003833 [Polypedilum vanderplanki]|uniref:HTH psq-type domain-containing protein n=1 Tax=Polypedilum vanderplanki TaxID=319348 RepID=A0A9J6BV74_POLVA|nr:hypothetical protein PVAND_003833 [Polypedilum vanderplanki]
MDTKDERLERVAEELMGRRKWKQYQESLTQTNTNDLIEKQSPSIEEETSNNKQQQQQQNSENNKTGIKAETLDIKEENKLMTTEDVSEKLESDYCKTTITDTSNREIEATEYKNSIKIETTRPEPVDWKPDDNCNFCVNGKLLKVNEIGELVVETGPVHPESELNKHIVESDDSSSGSDTVQKNNNQPQLQFQSSLIQKNLETLLKTVGLNPNMTSLESMAAQLAAFQRLQTPELNQLNPFYPNLFYPFQQQQQISPTTTPDRSASPSVIIPSNDESPTGQVTGEQPLDLSAKPSGSTQLESKNIFKAKPRISTVPGRRSYTEEELNNALQDILSGKLGTRRAAVLYGIPRSTLRNKVYKLATEQRRELLANHPPIAILEDEDEKDSGGEEEKDQPKVGDSNEQLQNYLKLLAKSSENLKQDQHQESKDNRGPSSWPIDPTAWIQSLILANGFQGMGGFSSLLGNPSSTSPSSSLSPKQEELPEFLRKLLTQPQDNKSEFNNKLKNDIDPLMMMNLLQQNKKTPELDMNEGSEDSNAILKIPSIPKAIFGQQPALVGTATHSKNGDIVHHSGSNTPSTSPQMAISPRLQVGSALANHLTMRSPSSLMRQRSESESPEPRAKFNLQDVIRQSISKNFQTNILDDPKHSTPLTIDPMNDYQKRPTISVIKSLGGTDLSRFGTNPNITQLQQQQLSPNNTGTGGKGTRPKRGKYRNYDRDSLVEAVKAVQRGEMSVHRAGSYYGVPHSTLEYKVKERHLMRPRKREPKPQPLDGTSTSSSAASTAASVKRQEVPSVDKNKPLSLTKSPMKSPFASPNGLKIPPFIDHAQMAAQLQLQSQLLWPHPSSFPGLSALDFARSSSQNNTPSFSPNAAENFFAQQMLQKFQEDQQNQQQQQFKPPVNGGSNNAGQNNNIKRDIESFYDPVSTNGSFLDGIIRSSLDKKSGEINHGALFEQLLKKNSLPASSSIPSDSSEDFKTNNKRPGSPMNYSHIIKKERTSPPPNHNNDLGFALHDEQQRQTSALAKSLAIKEEVNGSLHNNDDVNS